MANEMPDSAQFSGLSRKVLQYSESFLRIITQIKESGAAAADWTGIEELVDAASYRRLGVFLGDRAEVSGWQQYKDMISMYGGMTAWEGSLRRITEVPGLVYLELEERNTRGGVTDVSNTVTIYEFDANDKIVKLDVYVMPVAQR